MTNTASINVDIVMTVTIFIMRQDDFFPSNFYQYKAENFESLKVGEFVVFKGSSAAFLSGRRPGDAGRVLHIHGRYVTVIYQDKKQAKISPAQLYKCVF